MCNPTQTGDRGCDCPTRAAMEGITLSITQQRDIAKKIRAGVLTQLARDIQQTEAKNKKKVTLAEYTRLFRLQRLVEVFEDGTALVLQLRGWYQKNSEELAEEHDAALQNGIQKIVQQTKSIVQTFTENPGAGQISLSSRIGLPLEKKIARFHDSLEGLLVVLHNMAVFIDQNGLLPQDQDSPHVELPDISLLEIRLPQKYVFTSRKSIRVTEMAH